MTQNYSVNFRKLKARVTMRDLLRHFEIRLPEWKDNEGRGSCPLPDCTGKRTFTVNTTKQVYRCHACKRGGDIIDFAKIKQGLSTLKEAGAFLATTFLMGAEKNDDAPQPNSETSQGKTGEHWEKMKGEFRQIIAGLESEIEREEKQLVWKRERVENLRKYIES